MNKYMNKNLLLSLVALLLTSCYGDYMSDQHEKTSVYCSHQKPVRTVIPGVDEDIVVGVALGGFRVNNHNHQVDYVIDETLLLQQHLDQGYEILPADYYTVDNKVPAGSILVSQGKLGGGIELTFDMDKLMADAKAYTNHYVFPFKIVDSTLDEILPTKSTSLTVVKYINAYHGVYAHKGQHKMYDMADNLLTTTDYNEPDLEKNKVWKLHTEGRNLLRTPSLGALPEGLVNMQIAIDGADVQLTSMALNFAHAQCAYDASKKTLTLEYSFEYDNKKHRVSEQLIFRSHDIRFETWD